MQLWILNNQFPMFQHIMDGGIAEHDRKTWTKQTETKEIRKREYLIGFEMDFSISITTFTVH